MRSLNNLTQSRWGQRLRRSTLLAFFICMLSVGFSGVWWQVSNQPAIALAQGDAITDPTSLLRYALPFENPTVRKFQEDIEGLSRYLRSKRWSPVKANLKNANLQITVKRDKMLATVPEELQPEASLLIEDMAADVEEMREFAKTKDRANIWLKRREVLNHLTELEEMMVTEFPFEVPAEYANLPQLKGRATILMETNKGDLTVVLDGYSAPVNAGNFLDLVQRGFYDGLNMFITEEFAVQSGDPPGPDDGFIDPGTDEYRSIPLEVLIRGDEEPIYGEILEDLGIYLPDLVLPFNSYGAIALARPDL
ncbi:MAG: peptidylprolyl isomerase, partial [Cyanobacteria bacterium P01_H01_bin.15]